MAKIPEPKTKKTNQITTVEWVFEIGPSYSNPPLPDAVHDYLCKLWGKALPGGHGCLVKITLRVDDRK
jgi:hypothetical protein